MARPLGSWRRDVATAGAWELYYWLIVGVACAVGLLASLLVERPAMAIGRRLEPSFLAAVLRAGKVLGKG